MNVSRPDLADRPLNTPFQISTLRGHAVYCYYTVKITCGIAGSGAAASTSGSITLLIDDPNPPVASFGQTALHKDATLPIDASEQDEVICQLSGVVLSGQWVELQTSADSGSPTFEILNAVEFES